VAPWPPAAISAVPYKDAKEEEEEEEGKRKKEREKERPKPVWVT
jgi:hypothetical protein